MDGSFRLRVIFQDAKSPYPEGSCSAESPSEWGYPLLSGYDYVDLAEEKKAAGLLRRAALGRRFVKAFQDFQPELIVTWGYYYQASWEGLIVGKSMGIPSLVHGDSTLLASRPLWRKVLKTNGLFALRHLVNGAIYSGELSRDYWLHYGFKENRVFHLPHALDEAFLGEKARDGASKERLSTWKEQFQIEDDTLVIGTAARLVDIKGLDGLIQTFQRIDAPHLRLLLAGDGKEKEALQALAKKDKRIHFLGFLKQDEMPSFYEALDLFVLPSLREPWGLVVNEALFFQKPLLLSDQVGAASELAGPENAWVYKAGHLDALRDKLEMAVLQDDAKSKLKAMGKTGRVRLEGRTVDANLKRIHEIARALGISPKL